MIQRPIILGTETLRAILEGEGIELWVRERFSTRLDGDKIKIRYPADGPDGQVQFVPADQVPSKYRTAGYVTRPARHMPRWASRTTLTARGNPRK